MDERTVVGDGDGGAPVIHDAGVFLNLNPHLVEPFNESSLALVVLDGNQRFVQVNTAACQFFGRTHDDLLGRGATELL